MSKAYEQHRDQGTPSGQPSMETFMARSNKYGNNHPEQQRITQLLLENLIVKGCLPLGIVEADWFRGFMNAIHPKYSLPSRSHLTLKLLPQLREATETKVLAHIAKAEDISLTVDIWTDRRMHAFLAMTGHTFVEYECQSFLVAFESFRGSHSGQNIAEAIERCLEKYSLRNKARYMVSDNASNMRKAFSVLEELASDVNIDSGGLDAEDLWNDLESTDLDDVSYLNESIYRYNIVSTMTS